MKHRLLLVLAAASLAACGGRTQAVTPPRPIDETGTNPPPPLPDRAIPAATTTAKTTAPAPLITTRALPDTSAKTALKLALDSAADALVLDSLAKLQLSATLPDVPIDHAIWDLNVASFAEQPRVKYYLDYFTGRAHDRFQVWLQRMGRFEDFIRAEFAARKLPGDFVYLALIESGFSPEAVSKAYAVGMWQFMLGTGRGYGLRVDSWLDERRDPLKATTAAAHYLDDLTQKFGSHYLAAAAYNTGAGRVERSLGRLNLPSTADTDSTNVGDAAFFSLADTRMIYDETKNYVPQLIAAAILAKEPNKYGFDAPSDITPFSRDSVMVEGGTGLDLIARLADTTIEAMHELNPHLLRMITPPGELYPVRVPTGSVDKIATAYYSMAPEQRHAITVHQVRSGETVASIAKHYAVSADLIRSANRVARAKSVPVGTVLYLPMATTLVSAVLREPDPPRTLRVTTRTITVKGGESVAAVARRAGVSSIALRSANGLSANAVLHAGQKLVVRRSTIVTGGASSAAPKGKRAAPAPVDPSTQVRTHVVKAGETLYVIAKKFNVKPAMLISLNGLDKQGTVKAGQTLKIPHG